MKKFTGCAKVLTSPTMLRELCLAATGFSIEPTNPPKKINTLSKCCQNLFFNELQEKRNKEHIYTEKYTMYQRKVDVDMLNAVKSVLADVSSVSPSSEQRAKSKELTRAKARNVSQHALYGVQHIHINLTLIHCTFYRHADADQN